MSENSSLELMFMFIQPTLSFLYALLVSRVGKYDFGFILASYRAEAHLFGTTTLITLLKQQMANGVVCLASTVIDRQQWLAEHRQKPTCLGHLF